MYIKVIFHQVFHAVDPETFSETIEFKSEVNENITIQELFDKAGYSCADISGYYDLSGEAYFNSGYLPYIINSKGQVEWDVPFEEAKVKDFILTHSIKGNIISAETGYVQAGGPGWKELMEIWQLIYPVIDQVVTVLGLGTIIGGATKWVRSLFTKEDILPQAYFDLIFSRNEWNHHELAGLLDITGEEAKQLIKIFGYKYNRNKMMFIKQPISEELRIKLSKINVLNT